MKKTLLIISIIILIFLIVVFHRKNKPCPCHDNSKLPEPFSLFNNPEKELNKMKTSVVEPGVLNVKTNLALCQYFIKSSYNTAYTGTYMNLDAITHVLSRGCRFIDFQVFLIDGKPQVAYTNDPTFTNITSKNHLLLSDVFKYVNFYGFKAPCPNPNDPLFIQLRIQPNYVEDPSAPNTHSIYKAVAQSIKFSLQNKLYKGIVTKNTLIGDIMQKIIIIIDKTTSPDYKNYPNCDILNEQINCMNLTKYINIESGGDTLRNNTYGDLMEQLTTPPYIKNDGENVQITTLRLTQPEKVNYSGNPLYYDFVTKYGVQFMTQRFYIQDNNLDLYEQFFNENGFAFVPFSLALPYIEKNRIY